MNEAKNYSGELLHCDRVMEDTIDFHLEKIVSVIRQNLEVYSILLLGSAARDELSFRCQDGALELFSDYEFLIVTTNRPTSEQRSRLTQNVKQIETEIANPNPLFHIDFIIRKKSRLSKLPPIIFTYEMKQNAKLLYGADIKPYVPDVTVNNLNFRNTNEILFKRLWAILLHLPLRFVTGDMSETERRVAGYVLCRNALDITTVLLPYEHILLPTYGQRTDILRRDYEALTLSKRLGPEFPNYLQFFLMRRSSLDFTDVDLGFLYGRTIQYLQSAIIGLLPSEELTDLPQYAPKIFNETPISRGEWYLLMKMVLQASRHHKLPTVWRWFKLPKKGWLTVGLLAMHHSLIAWQKKDFDMAEKQLEKSLTSLNRLSIQTVTLSETSFSKRWLELRQKWGYFWQSYIRLDDNKYTRRFIEIMTWKHD